jgi:hypothetical protein
MVSCYDKRNGRLPNVNAISAEAYVPVYGVDSIQRVIKSMAPRETQQAGKIYVFGNYLFQVERLQGVHVIDYSNRKSPKKIGFIQSAGCSEIAVKNGYLIANNLQDLVTIDIRQLDSVKESARISNAFPHFYNEQSLPPQRGKAYVCPEWSKGTVIGWTLEKNVRGANCFN